MDANLTNILYIAFRLSPFIIVCFFTLESFLNWNLKGVVYLFGLLFACVITIFVSNTMPPTDMIPETNNEDNQICNYISIGTGGSLLSKLPLSTAVFSYTFFYLLTFILTLASKTNTGFAKQKSGSLKLAGLQTAMTQNIPTLILFPLLLLIDGGWNIINNCTSIFAVVLSIILGGCIGLAWGSIISSTSNPNLMYISGIMGDVCSKPTKTLFRCKKPNSSKS